METNHLRVPVSLSHECLFHDLIEQSIDGVVVINRQGTIQYSNPAAQRMFGLNKDDLNNTPFGFPTSYSNPHEIDLLRSDGSTLPIELRVLNITCDRESGYLAYLRDITERRKAEAKQRRHDLERQYAQKIESLGVLAGGIAHDFNNLLMSIVARAGLALRLLPDNSPAREHIRTIEQSGLKGGELANQMLTFAGKTRLDFEQVVLHEFLKEMNPLLRAAVSKRISLTLKTMGNLPPIHGDRSQLRQLLINIVTNASEAIGDQVGTIQISTASLDTSAQDLRHYYIIGDIPWGSCITLKIKDSGTGITPETIPKIFDPFFSTKFPGRGLGLAALLGIIRGHGAAIAIHSVMGEGTEFMLLFPMMEKRHIPPSPSLILPTESAHAPRQTKVLVVDDEEEVRTACTLILAEIGLDTLVAPDGTAGIKIFDQYGDQLALIFLDLTMPNIDGANLAAYIRSSNAHVPILVSSGFTEAEAMKHFQRSDVTAFVQKPFQVDTFINKVQELITMPVTD